VDLVENWESIEKIVDTLAYLKGTGSYRLKNVPKGVELRVRIGKYGYMNIFKSSEDPELIKILAFCQAKEFYKLQGSISDDVFFA
jgi:hypothetical protein